MVSELVRLRTSRSKSSRRTRVSSSIGPRIQTSRSKSSRRWFLTDWWWFPRLSGYRLAGVSLVDGHTRVSSSIGPRIETSSSKSSRRWFLTDWWWFPNIVRLQTSSSKSSRRWFLTDWRWFPRLSGYRLAVVSLVDGHEFPVV